MVTSFWDMQLKSKAKVILSLWSSPLYFSSFYVESVHQTLLILF